METFFLLIYTAKSAFAQCCGIHVFSLNKLQFFSIVVPFYMFIGNTVSIFFRIIISALRLLLKCCQALRSLDKIHLLLPVLEADKSVVRGS